MGKPNREEAAKLADLSACEQAKNGHQPKKLCCSPSVRIKLGPEDAGRCSSRSREITFNLQKKVTRETLDDAYVLLGLLENAGFEARLVGGMVRDLLLGLPLGDADIATTARPDDVTKTLEAQGLKVVPTGVEFGTVTAVVRGKGYEITTLREDVETDGRHARVTFTKDWQQDAARRDFTMNAMSRDARGVVYDYFGGAEDARAGRIRFVGDAASRLKEDYLRLLRFFRFMATHGRETPDAQTLAALRGAVPHVPRLSRERVWKELSRLLAAKNPVPAWALMQDVGAADVLLPHAHGASALQSLLTAEAYIKGFIGDDMLRLAALIYGGPLDANALQSRFAFSNAAREKLALLLKNPLHDGPSIPPLSLPASLYYYGVDSTREFMVLAAAKGIVFDWESARAMLENWQPKTFPLKGEDLLAAGALPGPSLGAALRSAEAWWIEKSFAPEKEACLAKALEFLK